MPDRVGGVEILLGRRAAVTGVASVTGVAAVPSVTAVGSVTAVPGVTTVTSVAAVPGIAAVAGVTAVASVAQRGADRIPPASDLPQAVARDPRPVIGSAQKLRVRTRPDNAVERDVLRTCIGRRQLQIAVPVDADHTRDRKRDANHPGFVGDQRSVAVLPRDGRAECGVDGRCWRIPGAAVSPPRWSGPSAGTIR